MDPTLFPILNALLVFYFVDQLRLLTAAVPPWGRFIFGAEMLGGTLFLIWLIRSKQLSPGIDRCGSQRNRFSGFVYPTEDTIPRSDYDLLNQHYGRPYLFKDWSYSPEQEVRFVFEVDPQASESIERSLGAGARENDY
jgi:hypothetical protein